MPKIDSSGGKDFYEKEWIVCKGNGALPCASYDRQCCVYSSFLQIINSLTKKIARLLGSNLTERAGQSFLFFSKYTFPKEGILNIEIGGKVKFPLLINVENFLPSKNPR